MLTDKDSAITADYAQLKFVQGRKVAQIILEIPIEQGAEFVRMFGTPNPEEGTPVALARLNIARKETEA